MVGVGGENGRETWLHFHRPFCGYLERLVLRLCNIGNGTDIDGLVILWWILGRLYSLNATQIMKSSDIEENWKRSGGFYLMLRICDVCSH